jgi:hypothetical protein
VNSGLDGIWRGAECGIMCLMEGFAVLHCERECIDIGMASLNT